jgi:hypothetical protein
MLREPSIRAGTAASSGQEAPEAATRSGGLTTQAERRAIISDPPPIAATTTPEPISEPTPPDAALAPLEDLTTLRATLAPAVAVPGQTVRAPEAPPFGASWPAPAEKQATPLTTSPTISLQATQFLPNQHPAAAEIAALNADLRRHIPQQLYRVTDWAEYDAACASAGA